MGRVAAHQSRRNAGRRRLKRNLLERHRRLKRGGASSRQPNRQRVRWSYGRAAQRLRRAASASSTNKLSRTRVASASGANVTPRTREGATLRIGKPDDRAYRQMLEKSSSEVSVVVMSTCVSGSVMSQRLAHATKWLLTLSSPVGGCSANIMRHKASSIDDRGRAQRRDNVRR